MPLTNSRSHQLPFVDGAFHCIITSPPYFGLRKYKGEQEIVWPGGIYAPCTGAPPCIELPGPRSFDKLISCNHDWTVEIVERVNGGGKRPPQTKWLNGTQYDEPKQTAVCHRCGAWRGGYGSEPTPEMYVWHTLLILRELRRVLRDDGVLWWNIGDSYMSAKGRFKNAPQTLSDGNMRDLPTAKLDGRKDGWSDGQLIGIPHRVMLAAQADGWIVRNDVIWHKIAAMPESVDGTKFKASTGEEETTLRHGSWRHTRAHEFILMMVKQMGYWADGYSVKEPSKNPNDDRKGRAMLEHKRMPTEKINGIRPRASATFKRNGSKREAPIVNQSFGTHRPDREDTWPNGTRNPRSVITPRPSGYRGDHFAVYPPDLIAPLLRATCPAQCCPQCGAGWSPIVEQNDRVQGLAEYDSKFIGSETGLQQQGFIRSQTIANERAQSRIDAVRLYPGDLKAQSQYIHSVHETGRPAGRVNGYRQTCNCPPCEPRPGRVLDPFVGSGTTVMVARELGLIGIGADISLEYLISQALARGDRKTSEASLSSLPLFSDNLPLPI